MPFSKGVSENSILFFQGGHKHDGVSSSLIDVTKYSIYDFIVGKTGDSARQAAQQKNFDSLKGVISSIITTDILGPSGVRLGPNSVQSVNIAAGAVTAGELAANIVLVNNIISSSNFDGTVAANGVITGQGTAGWAITSAGDAVFSNTAIRGTLTAGSLYINNFNLWTSNGEVLMGDPASNSASFIFNPTLGLAIEGTVTATAGKIASFLIDGDSLYTGGAFLGAISLGPLTTGYNSAAAGALVVETRDYDFELVTSIVRGQDISVFNDTNTKYSILSKYGLETSGGVIYNSYSTNQIGFYWDGTNIYAIIDDTTQICLTQCGTSTADPGGGTGGGGGGAGGDCVTCYDLPEPCCPPATCGTDAKLGNYCL
jgi:hypothetical protein